MIIHLLKNILKNLLIFLSGGIFGMSATLIFAKQLLESVATKDLGLGIIAVAPILILIYGAAFGMLGGLISVIIYNLVRYVRRRKQSRSFLPKK